MVVRECRGCIPMARRSSKSLNKVVEDFEVLVVECELGVFAAAEVL